MTQGQINAAFARGELTPRQAADATMANRAASSPLMAAATWGVLSLVVLLLLAYALWWAHSGER